MTFECSMSGTLHSANFLDFLNLGEKAECERKVIERTYAPLCGAVSSRERFLRATLIVIYIGVSLYYAKSLIGSTKMLWWSTIEEDMLTKVLSVATLISFVLLLALLQSTSPATVHPIIILVVFVLIYALALGVLTFLIFMASKLTRTLPWVDAAKPMTVNVAYYYASVLAIAPVIIVGMLSIGRASWYEIALVVLFEVVACFYISKRH